jgi:hypothetical protein
VNDVLLKAQRQQHPLRGNKSVNHMANTIQGLAKPPRLPCEDEIMRLADLARVPQEKEARIFFSDFILNVLLPELRFLCELPVKRPHNDAVIHAVQAVHSAKLAIANLDSKDREILVGPFFASEIDSFLFRAEGKQTLARHQAMRRGTNRRGRRSGTVRNQGALKFGLRASRIPSRPERPSATRSQIGN